MWQALRVTIVQGLHFSELHAHVYAHVHVHLQSVCAWSVCMEWRLCMGNAGAQPLRWVACTPGLPIPQLPWAPDALSQDHMCVLLAHGNKAMGQI